MFKGLDDIQWGELTHAYGEASDVPQLLRDLASDDEETRKSALYSLYGNIYHQGTVYEATAYAIPFIVEILEMPNAQNRPEVLSYLMHVAHGNSYLDVHQHLEWAYPEEERESDEFKEQLSTELSWVRAAYIAVAKYHAVYLRLLSHDDEATRMHAVQLLASLPTLRDKVLPVLKERLNQETSISVKATIINYMPYLIPPEDPAAVDLVKPYIDERYEPIVRFFAAQAYAQFAREKTPQAVLDILVDALEGNPKIAEAYDNLSWVEDSLGGSIGQAMCFVGLDVTKPIIPKLIDMLKDNKFMSAISLTNTLLYLLFYGKRVPTDFQGGDLNDLQRQALTVINDHALQMNLNDGRRSINGNVGGTLRAYGLPSQPETLAEFVQTK